MIEDGGPAFPVVADEQMQNDAWGGMSLRDYFAAKAMQAWLSTYGYTTQHPAGKDTPPEWAMNLAKASYRLADAMLRARGAA